MRKQLQGWLRKIRVYLDVTRARGIARRYFVMNGFDGSMTMFGIVIGSWVAGITEPGIVVAAGFGACLAMGVSGFFGAFMAERAERKGHLKTLEESTPSLDPLHHDASKFVSVYVALIDGMSPTLTAIVSLTPFILTRMGLFSIGNIHDFSNSHTGYAVFAWFLFRKNCERKRLVIWHSNGCDRDYYSNIHLPFRKHHLEFAKTCELLFAMAKP